MDSIYDPPTYEESNDQYKTFSKDIKNEYFTKTRGPDLICTGKSIIIADFVPWSGIYPCEDLGYLLLRANNWLQDNPLYDVLKCEMIPRMINSKEKLEISNCYIFNITYGRRYFINQLRLHIKVHKFKESTDQICLQTVIPEIIEERSNLQKNSIFSISLRRSNFIPKFDDMSYLLSKLNNFVQEGKITGRIINISSFYLNIVQNLTNSELKFQDDLMYFEEFNQGKCHLKCLRVFYKPGETLNSKICIKSFIHSKEAVHTLNDLTYSSLEWIKSNKIEHVISMETFSLYTAKMNFKNEDDLKNVTPTFIFFDKNLTLVKTETINIFYLPCNEYSVKELQNIDRNSEIIWITPRKYKNIYETYNSFLCYVRYFLENFDSYIIDMESVFVQNPLSWSKIRHQTLERYYSENTNNYQIFTIKVLVVDGKITLPLKEAPLPCISPSKYSAACSII